MSTTYTISRFSKPLKNDLKDIFEFRLYSRHEIYEYDDDDDEGYYTGQYIQLFRMDDHYMENLRNTRFAVPLVLPETVTDYNRMYKAMGFSEESINNNKIHLRSYNGCCFEYYDDMGMKYIEDREMRKFDIQIQTECFAIKIEELWNSDEPYVHVDRDKVYKYFPDIDKYAFVPVNNSLLAKAEIPFLIFERNRGRCFLDES